MIQHSPEYYKFLSLKNKVIAINGPIGSGKSTLGAAIVEWLKRCGLEADFIPENINWGFLKKSIEEPLKYKFSFQLNTLQKRGNTHRAAIAAAKHGKIVVEDRDLAGDIGFAEAHRFWRVDGKVCIDEDQFALYVSEIVDMQLPQSDLMIRLMCPTKTAIHRTAVRARTAEDLYDAEYFDALEEGLTRAINERYHNPILELPWHVDLSTSGDCNLSESGDHIVEINDELVESVLDQLLEVEKAHRNKK